MDKEKVLAQLADVWAVTDIRDDELTLNDVRDALKAAGSKHSKEFTTRRMKSLLEAGLVERREVRIGSKAGGVQYAYSPVEGKSWEDVLQYIKVN